jgi:hypothetical protein
MNKRLRQLVDSLKEDGLDKTITILKTPESRQTHKDVDQFLDNLDEFEEASIKVHILVYGNGCSYCHHENVHSYPNYC